MGHIHKADYEAPVGGRVGQSGDHGTSTPGVRVRVRVRVRTRVRVT